MNVEGLISRAGRGLTALYFETGFFGAIGLFSAFMSSPWTIERTAKSPEASEATLKYTWLAHATNLVGGAFVSLLARSLAPLAGTAIGTGYMGLVYRYSRAQGLEKATFNIAGFDAEAGVTVAAARGRRR